MFDDARALDATRRLARNTDPPPGWTEWHSSLATCAQEFAQIAKEQTLPADRTEGEDRMRRSKRTPAVWSVDVATYVDNDGLRHSASIGVVAEGRFFEVKRHSTQASWGGRRIVSYEIVGEVTPVCHVYQPDLVRPCFIENLAYRMRCLSPVDPQEPR